MSKKKRNIFLNPRKGEVESFDVAEASEEWIKLFGANKNIYRTFPSLIDGLKPVQRRILYSLHTNENHGLKNRKVQRISGDTMGRFHPHGDASINEAITNMAQEWRNNICLIQRYSSFGSISGDKPAAPRYIEASLSKFSDRCFFSDMNSCNVPMLDAYTGEEKEPEYLPARYPVILMNPQLSGIGYGSASNIPPFNPKEVLEATISLLRDKKHKIELIPDSPTGCDVIDNGEFKQINKTGKGKFGLQATYEIDYVENVVRITSVPLQVDVDRVIEKLVALKKLGSLDELYDIKDKTKDSTVDLRLYLNKKSSKGEDINPDKFIEKIMKKNCGLREGYSCEIRVVDDYKPKILPPKKILLEWIDYRRDCVISIYNNLMVKTMSDYHMNKVLMFIFNKDNAENTLKIAKQSKNKADMKEKLMKTYKITSIQAETISNMRVSSFNKDRYAEYMERDKTLKSEIKKVEKVLESDHEIDKIIIQQLEEGIKLFGYPRKSRVIKEGMEKDMIPDTDFLIGISKDGYIKKVTSDHLSIGAVGKCSSVCVIKINNRDNLLIFDSEGKISRVNVSVLPEMEYKENGIELERFFRISGDVITIMKETDVIECVNSNIILVTEKGYGKKVSLSEFKNLNDQKVSITLNDGDKLVSAIPSLETDDLIIYTNFGDGIRLSIKEFKLYGKTAKGLNLLSLKVNEKVVGIDILDGNKDKLVYITSSGRMKMTKEEYLPVMKRKDEPVSLISLENNENLINVSSVDGTEEVLCYRKKSKPIFIKLSDVPLTSRIAKAVKMVKTPKGDDVVACSIIKS